MKRLKIYLRAFAVLAICIFTPIVYGGVIFADLFSFSGTNGIEPEGQLLQMPDGDFYGTARDTTLEKWGNANFGFRGNGAIFRITTNGLFSIMALFMSLRPEGKHLHKLFDAGLISFYSSGKMLVSSKLSRAEQSILGLIGKRLLKKPSSKTAKYLSHHRNFF